MTESTASNGIAPSEKTPSALDSLLKSLNGSVANETDKKKVGAEFKKTMGKRAELQKALDDFDASTDELAVKMVKCFGKTSVSVEGVRYVPTSRGKRVYYKRMTDKHEVHEL